MGALHGPFYIDSSEVHAYAAKLGTAAKVTPAQMRKTVRHYGALLQRRVKKNASLPRGGPPGPRIITGDYNRSITTEYQDAISTATAVVGTNAVQGRRLEYGFFGVDSLGRHYRQPAYAHFRPAADDIEPEFVAAMLSLGGEGL